MNLNALEKLNNTIADSKVSKNQPQDALRKVAEQFEAVLLMQLTSALNGSSDDGEESLFGSDGGSDLAKKMFSEQMATAMAKGGGIGLADLIMKKLQGNAAQPVDNKTNPLKKSQSAVNEIRNSTNQVKQSNNYAPNNISEETTMTSAPQIFVPEAEALMNTRARVVADKPITYSEDVSAPNEVYSPSPVSASSPLSPRTVSFQMPTNGRISSSFGNRFHPIDKRVKFHGGLDIAVPLGTRVNSAADGVVAFAGQKGGYGNLVIIQHPDGRETRYGHLQKILVSAGDPVSAGQEVAKSGSTGKSTGPHLHFEIRENGQVVNPLKILSNVLAKNNR
jgi:murein DD-endopeptidase MepM/ murein hydrolase activator NlpD